MLVFQDRVSHSTGLSQIYYVSQDDLELLMPPMQRFSVTEAEEIDQWLRAQTVLVKSPELGSPAPMAGSLQTSVTPASLEISTSFRQ